MNILHINVFDVYGGGEAIMRRLCEGVSLRGHQPRVLVREKMTDKFPFPISLFEHEAGRSFWGRSWRSFGRLLMDGPGKNRKWIRGVARFFMGPIAEPVRQWRMSTGREDFDFPDTLGAIGRIRPEPDIIHIHCFHGKYFDLRQLPAITSWKPVVVTLHDAWMFTGHCAYPGECDRFRVGCGQCPDLKRYPAVPRDATAQNFALKKELYSYSQIFAVAPSQWMMEQLKASALGEVMEYNRVIPNGIDTDYFSPGDPIEARHHWEIPADGPLLLYVARNARSSPYKDYRTVRRAAEAVAASGGGPLHLLVLGDEAPPEQSGNLHVRFSLTTSPDKIRAAYRAADIVIHAAQAENFPTTILEAMACGCPVIATRTGGIPEQLLEGETGFLVEPGDATAMARSIFRLLDEPDLQQSFGRAARTRAINEFDRAIMTEQYLEWYRFAIDHHTAKPGKIES